MTDSNDKLTALTKDQKFELKRKLTYLAKVKGSGTQLISVYIPAGYPLHEVTNKLRNELGQASNIKSKSTKINVMDALEKVIGYMKNLGKTPENGVAIFCGNVSQTHSKNDVQLFVIMPPVALNTQIYRCDSRFFLEPFERIISQTDIYGILAMDGRHATLAYLKGTQIEKLKELNSTAHSKIHVGGQCLHQDTLVQRSDGVITEIKNLLPNDYVKVSKISQYSVNDSICPIITKNSERPIFLVKTLYPVMSILATAGHRFFVLTKHGVEERLLRDLRPGDKILSAVHIPHKGMDVLLNIKLVYRNGAVKLKVPDYLTPDIAQVIGYATGDGHFDGDKLVFYESKKELVDYYYHLLSKTFGVKPKIRVIDKTKQKSSFAKKTYFELRVYSRNMGRLLKQISSSIFNPSDTKDMPDKLMMAKNNVCAAYIRGLYDAEGYFAGKKVEIAMTSEILMRKVHMLLLRFGIVSSFYEKFTGPAQKKRQWGIIISDLKSVKLFRKQIGFTLTSKDKKLEQICKTKIISQLVRQAPVHGAYVLKQAHKMKLKTRDFDGLNMFFCGRRGIGKQRFNKKVLSVFQRKSGAKHNEIVKEMKSIAESGLTCSMIEKIIPKGKEKTVYDITIPNYGNFIANNIIVHNSAARFQRLITEETEFYYKRIGKYVSQYFLPEKVKGIIIGGPGPAKENFLKMKPFNYQVNVIGQLINVGYTDVAGINEIVRKSSDIISEQEAIQEKKMIAHFIGEVVKNGLAVYGLKPVIESIKFYKAQSVLISEELEYTVELFKNENNEDDVRIIKPEAKTQNQTMPLIDYLVDIANKHNIEYHFISTNTTEGAQFKAMFLGIGAFLRYK